VTAFSDRSGDLAGLRQRAAELRQHARQDPEA